MLEATMGLGTRERTGGALSVLSVLFMLSGEAIVGGAVSPATFSSAQAPDFFVSA